MLKKIVIIASLILTISILLVLGYYFYTKHPKKITQYHGLELGMAASEVKYRKGMPTGVLGEMKVHEKSGEYQQYWQVIQSAKVNNPNLEVSSENVEKYKYWEFDEDKHPHVSVTFDVPNGNLVEINCYSKEEVNFCNKVNDIGINSTEADVKKKLGKPSKETIKETIKTIQYKSYNIELLLEKERVYYIKVRKIDS